MIQLRKAARTCHILFWAVVCWTTLGTSAKAVHYGDIVEPSQYRAVGIVIIVDSSGQPRGIGTGTLIAPDLVITAAHVIDSALTPHHIKFKLDGRPECTSVVAWRVPRDYLRAVGGSCRAPYADMAILKLGQRFGEEIEYYPLELDSVPESKAPMRVVGFGKDETRKLNIRTTGKLQFFREIDDCLLCVPGDKRNQTIDSGDSGGPLFLEQDGKLRIAGIVQAKLFSIPPNNKHPDYEAIDHGQFSGVYLNRDWLRKVIDELNGYPIPDKLSYIPRSATDELSMSFSAANIIALLHAHADVGSLITFLTARGMNEPWTPAVRTDWSSAGGEGLVTALEPKTLAPATVNQLLTLHKANATEGALREYLLSHAGLDRRVDENVIMRLQDAGISAELIEYLRHYPRL